MSKETTTSGIGLGTVLFIIFLVLKLTNLITWSWWWVTSPLWIPILIIAAIFAIAGLFAILAKLIN